MDSSFLSYAILIEVILLLIGWIVFLHWRLSKKKKALKEATEIEPPNPYEVYMQYLNRELSETKSHLDKLTVESPEDIETINMYQYRLKHLDAEQQAMHESKGEVVKFWELYRSNIEFVYHDQEEEDIEEEQEAPAEPEPEPAAETSEAMQGQLENYQTSSSALIEHSNNMIELMQKVAAQSDSQEMQHMISLLTMEKDGLQSQLDQMETEYSRLMNNAASMKATQVMVSQIDRDNDDMGMSRTLNQQNARVKQLSDLVGELSLELEDKKRLIEETNWVARQLKETEQVVVILEDENSFLRAQIKQLLDSGDL